MSVTASVDLGDGPTGMRITIDDDYFGNRNAELVLLSLTEATVKPESKVYTLDLIKVKNIDSSALKFIVKAYEFANEQNCNISMVNCRPAITTILHDADLHKLFRIEQLEVIE